MSGGGGDSGGEGVGEAVACLLVVVGIVKEEEMVPECAGATEVMCALDECRK